MAVKVAINGFGRIGRNILRAIVEARRKDIEVVAINDLGPVETNAHLLRFDLVHGRFPGEVKVTGDTIDVGTGPIKVTAIRNPAELPHKAMGVDIALECTGLFTSREKAKAHLEAGAKRVLISAPADGVDLTVVYGVNHEKLAGPPGRLERLLYDELPRPGGQGAQRSRRHRQRLHDDHPRLHRRPADARYPAQGPLPRPRRSAVDDPDLDRRGQGGRPRAARAQRGRLDGTAIRVPVPNVSVVDFKFLAKRETTKDEVNTAIRRAAEQELKGILAVTDQPNVSADFNHDSHSSVFHVDQTKVMDGKLVRVLSWYDNEWGFSNRMADTAVAMGKLL